MPLLHDLPPELVLHVIAYLHPVDFINLLFAQYDLLCRHRLVARLTPCHLADLLSTCALGTRAVAAPIERLPTEMLLDIVQCLPEADLANFTFAYYHLLQVRRLAPSLMAGMAPQFSIAISRSERRRQTQ
jgi:hypothetical protein